MREMMNVFDSHIMTGHIHQVDDLSMYPFALPKTSSTTIKGLRRSECADMLLSNKKHSDTKISSL